MHHFIQRKPVWLAVLMITLASSFLGFLIVPILMKSPDGTFIEVTLMVVIPSFFISLFVSIPVVYYYKKVINENHALIQSLQKDYLTGFLNRHAFYERYNQVITTSIESKKSIALIMLDIDNFKKINDHFGHTAGDEVIHYSALQVQNLLRKEDLVCRFGGEEFLIVLVDTNLVQAKECALRILKAMDTTFTYNNHPIKYSASIGLAYSDTIHDSDLLIQQADNFMY